MRDHYKIHGDTIHCKFEGELTLEHLLEGRRWVQTLPKEPPILKQIIDFTEVRSSSLKGEQLSDFARTRIFSRQARRAIVAPPGSLAYGIGRELQAYIDIQLGDEIQIFDTDRDAQRWLHQTETSVIPRHCPGHGELMSA
jgi:hypothetical protein